MSHPVIFPAFGQPFTLLPVVDSTNNYAMAQAQAGLAGHGAAFFALEQTAGKGQRGKTWQAQPGVNIILSLVMQPAAALYHQRFLLSAAVALACYDFFVPYAGNETSVKWPNDLYWRDRKAGGILIENSFRGNEWAYAIAGIGININQTSFDTGIRNPVSLKQITGQAFDVLALARELCTCVEQRYQQLATGAATSLLQQYNEVLYKRAQPVTLKKENAVFQTQVQGVSATGQLLTKDTLDRQFDFGEVEWVIN